MATLTFPDLSSSIRNTRRLPALRDFDTLHRNNLAPLKSSPAKLEASFDPFGRKKTVGSSTSKPKRVASVPKKMDENAGTINFFQKSSGKFNLVSPPKGSSSNPSRTDVSRKQKTEYSSSDPYTEKLQQLQLHSILPNSEPSRNSQKAYGLAKAFGVCTNQGLVRDYNEDRVSIVLDIPKPQTRTDVDPWPNCNIFAIFDGHGGSKCADFLRNNLHYYIARNRWFPTDPEEALREACEAAESKFIENQLTAGDGRHDHSGSCGLVMLIIEDDCYICNVGDSRAVASRNGGKIGQAVTRDHKPSDEQERMRILNAGGRVYQNFPSLPGRTGMGPVASGPCRLLPGGLAVSRAFGDIEAKIPRFGGNSNVLIAKPEITTLKINKAIDFIVLGSDGIYDVMSDDEVVKSVWDTIAREESSNVHELMKIASENLIKEALLKRSFDNVTVIIVAFPALERKLNPNTLDVEADVKNGLTLSPKPSSPQTVEEVVPEAVENPKLSPSHNSTINRLRRGERISPSKMMLTTLNKTLVRREGNRNVRPLKSGESNRREPEALPIIMPRVSVIKH